MKRQTIAKIVVILFSVLMIGVATSAIAFAATSASAYVSSDAEVSRGEEITFTVGINNGAGIQAIMIIPDYDSNAFELVSGDWTITGGLMSDFSVSTGDGVIAFSSGISINNAVLSFTLKAKDNATLGMQNVSAEVIITDGNGNSTLTTSGSSVQIKCNHDYSKQDFTYIKSEATCTTPAIYYKSCVICGEKGTEAFVNGTSLSHSYTRKVITDTYKKTGATCTAKAVYYYCCATCNAKGTETFEVGDAPSHNYQIAWSSDETSHWHECSKCGDKIDIASHNPGSEATETTDQVCTICAYVINAALGHTHNYGDEWMENSEEHWHECICGDKADVETHQWDDGIVTKNATEVEEGVKTYTCTKCAQTKIESIAKIPTSTNDSDNSAEIWITVAGVAIIGVSGSAAVILFRKKKVSVDVSSEPVSDEIKQDEEEIEQNNETDVDDENYLDNSEDNNETENNNENELDSSEDNSEE